MKISTQNKNRNENKNSNKISIIITKVITINININITLLINKIKITNKSCFLYKQYTGNINTSFFKF